MSTLHGDSFKNPSSKFTRFDQKNLSKGESKSKFRQRILDSRFFSFWTRSFFSHVSADCDSFPHPSSLDGLGSKSVWSFGNMTMFYRIPICWTRIIMKDEIIIVHMICMIQNDEKIAYKINLAIFVIVLLFENAL